MTAAEAAKQEYLDNNWDFKDKAKLFLIIAVIIFCIWCANKIWKTYMLKDVL